MPSASVGAPVAPPPVAAERVTAFRITEIPGAVPGRVFVREAPGNRVLLREALGDRVMVLRLNDITQLREGR